MLTEPPSRAPLLDRQPSPATPLTAVDPPAPRDPPTLRDPGDRDPDVDASLQVLVIGGGEQAHALQQRIAADGFLVRAMSPLAGVREVVRRPPDLLLLVGSRTCGLGALGRLRSVSTIGIITLGASGRVEECIQALQAGADDHLTPPIDHDELVARMWAVHRRTAPPSEPFLAFDTEQLSIDLARHEVIRAGRRLHLTSTELRLLELLVTQSGVLLTHEVLLRHVWGESYGTESNYLRVYVAQLRKKLGDSATAPRLIETTPGVGYRWIGSSSPAPRAVSEPVGAGR